MQRKIVQIPNPILRERSKPILRRDNALKRLMNDMEESNSAARGLGLAAVQIGHPVRLLHYDCAGRKGFMINPEILRLSQDMVKVDEGCLSIKGFFWEIERPSHVTVRWTEFDNTQHEEEFYGVFARLLQHEIDHMAGTLMVDYLSEEQYDGFERVFFGAGLTPPPQENTLTS